METAEGGESRDGTLLPVSGTCQACGCALGFVASEREGVWYCCGACAGSDQCSCGCKPEHRRELPADSHVPARRMFASRHPDDLNVRPDGADRARRLRAFPFADRNRGR